MKYGYVRVSSKTQDTERQIQALLKENILRENIFIEKKSGKTFAEKEREKILTKQREAYEKLELDEKGRKISRKKIKL